ncbi:MAG: metal ABC transporter substrate-binding protein [Oscillospiraceae bacterium]
MKRLSAMLIVCCLVLTLLAGCGNSRPQREEGKILVYASFYTVYDFAQKIGGDRAQVVCIMKPGAEPHDWEPTPQDRAGLEEADVFVYNGAGIDGWAESLLSGLDGKGLKIVKTTANVQLLQYDADSVTLGAGEEEDDHDHEDEAHDHGENDPHTWLYPENARLEMRAIADGLKEADPDNAEYYESNYSLWAAECGKLDEAYRQGLGPLTQRSIVVSHAAYGYLCNAYGLEQVAVQGFSPDAEPSPKKMAEVIDFINENGVKAIFFEEAASPAVAEAVSRETGVEVLVLNPVESLGQEQQEAGEDYFSVMEQNLETLLSVLA